MVLVILSIAILLVVAYPLYYILIASVSDPYDVYAGKTFWLPSQFSLQGYAAFGKVVAGMDVVDRIASVRTDWNDKPATPVRMKSVVLIDD